MTDPTRGDVRKVLSVHGYGFQYAVLRRAQALADSQRSAWVFEAAEFPVGNSPDRVIHADFILSSIHGLALKWNVYLVAECKRADPARARWCFMTAPYTRRNAYPKEVVFEEVVRVGTPYAAPGYRFASSPRMKTASMMETCHLGFELRTQDKGDDKASERAINDATTQVLRAVNGLVDHLFDPQNPARSSPAIQGSETTIILPAIFTTATLWVADGDLSDADLTTGRLSPDQGTVKPVTWLWFNYNQSRALRHGLPSVDDPSGLPSLAQALHADYTRTIAVIGPDGIDEFLQADLVRWLL